MVIAEKTKLIFLDYSIYYFQTQITEKEKNEPMQSFPDALFPFLFNLEFLIVFLLIKCDRQQEERGHQEDGRGQ